MAPVVGHPWTVVHPSIITEIDTIMLNLTFTDHVVQLQVTTWPSKNVSTTHISAI